MHDSQEVPEAHDSFGKKVAMTIAILAVMLAVLQNKGDNSRTDAILKTNEASNKWSHYQTKSLKQNLCETEARLIALLPSAADAALRADTIAKATAEAKRYNSEKEEIKVEAEKLAAAADHNSKINDRCDSGALGMQIAIVLCSVAILSRWRPFWMVGIMLGIIGSVIGATAFLM